MHWATAVARAFVMAVHTAESTIRDFHVYGDRWSPVIGEVLVCERESGNAEDVYAVAVLQSTSVVGHGKTLEIFAGF